MTLILSCLTPEYIIQVSDRKLTYPDGTVFDETANKAIVFHNRASIAYTGIAMIGSQRTDEWITDQIKHCTGVQDAITTLKKALDERIVQLAAPNRWLTVCFDLWGTQDPGQPDRPWSVALSNQIDPKTKKRPAQPLATFEQFNQTLPSGKSHAFLPLGEHLDTKIYKELVRNLVRVKRDKEDPAALTTPETMSRFMRDAVLATANWSKYVGSNVMTTVLYNYELETNQDKSNMYMFHPDPKSEAIHYAPTVITPHVAIQGLRMYSGPPRFQIKSTLPGRQDGSA
jgi:hypothetical protein